MGVGLSRVALVLVCHLVLRQVSVHPCEDLVSVRRDRVLVVDRHRVDLDACLVEVRRGCSLAVGHRCVVQVEVLQSLLWTGTGCSPDVLQVVSDQVLALVFQRLVLLLVSVQRLLQPVWEQALQQVLEPQLQELPGRAPQLQELLARAPLVEGSALSVQVLVLQASTVLQELLVAPL